MREILFHGKRIDNGEWVEGSLHIEWGETDKDGNCERDYRILGMRGECYYIDPATVGEFSGKCDDNDRRIFEGDIADGLFCFTTPVRAVCVFKDGAFGLKWTLGSVDHFSAFTSICNVACEVVVGNIYDNPELLKQEVE